MVNFRYQILDEELRFVYGKLLENEVKVEHAEYSQQSEIAVLTGIISQLLAFNPYLSDIPTLVKLRSDLIRDERQARALMLKEQLAIAKFNAIPMDAFKEVLEGIIYLCIKYIPQEYIQEFRNDIDTVVQTKIQKYDVQFNR